MATAKTPTICPTCQDGDHADCNKQGGNWTCVCDNSAHPDAGRRAMHTTNQPDPDLGPTSPPDTAEADQAAADVPARPR